MSEGGRKVPGVCAFKAVSEACTLLLVSWSPSGQKASGFHLLQSRPLPALTACR